jgi:hypothetical protein
MHGILWGENGDRAPRLKKCSIPVALIYKYIKHISWALALVVPQDSWQLKG